MLLLPISEKENENTLFIDHPDCKDNLPFTLQFYKKVGYHPPWIGYYAKKGADLVGNAAFKGKPRDGKVEIAYGTFPRFRQKGVGTEMCKQLVLLAQTTDPTVRITARTLPHENFSTKILRKNGFEWLGTIWDDEDGDVWEWEYKGH